MDTAEFDTLNGHGASQRPLDELVERLLEPDGHEWFERAVHSGPLGSAGTPYLSIVSGSASLTQLRTMKQEGKLLFRGGLEQDARLTGVVTYFSVLAAALTHHHCTISSREISSIARALVELAPFLPNGWRELYLTAAEQARRAGERT